MADINLFHVLIGISSSAIAIGVGDVIRRLYRMETKQDEQAKAEAACRLDLTENYAKWIDLTGPDGRITKIEVDRQQKWERQEKLNFQREHDLTTIKTKLKM